MVTTEKRRIREAPEPSGIIWGYRAAVRKYEGHGLRLSLLQSWVLKSEVSIIEVDGKVGIDEASLRRRLQSYQPHKDNQSRRGRTWSIGETQNGHSHASAPSPLVLPHHVVRSGGASAFPDQAIAHRPAPSTATDSQHVIPAGTTYAQLPAGIPLLLRTVEWLPLFIEDRTRRHGVNGELRPKTRASYDQVLIPFARHFPILPWERRTILEYIHGLKRTGRSGKWQQGKPVSSGTKLLHHRVISSLYNWLYREYQYPKVNLGNPGIQNPRERAIPLELQEARGLLNSAENHSEYTVYLVLLMTGVRAAELCTMRPETSGDHWVSVWGKVTKSNPSGYRRVPIPDPAWQHVQREFQTYGSLAVTNHCGIYPLAGPVQPKTPGRRVNLKEETSNRWGDAPQTYIVHPDRKSVKRLQDMVRRRLKALGLDEKGKNLHAARRSFEGWWKLNRGDHLAMRRIMGHYRSNDMDDVYYYGSIDDLVAEAQRSAPRQFLDAATDRDQEIDRQTREVLADSPDDEDDDA